MIGCYLGHGEPALLSGGEAMDEDDPEPGLLPAHSFLPVGQVPAVFEPDSRRGDQRSSWGAQDRRRRRPGDLVRPAQQRHCRHQG